MDEMDDTDEGFVVVQASGDESAREFCRNGAEEGDVGRSTREHWHDTSEHFAFYSAKHASDKTQDECPKYVKELCEFNSRIAPSLWRINDSMHSHPELAFQEHKTAKLLTDYLQPWHGWKIETAICEIETAWLATYDTGKPGPVVSFNAEMDALPNLGHACGHNLIASASLSAALATSHIASAHSLGGKILLFGTPGEEGYGGGKIRLLEAGAYKDVDITLISHPGIYNNSPMVRTTTFCRLEVEYHGRAAHAANSPWLGINALDALVIAYNAVAVLRQQTKAGDGLGMSITDGGGPPNVIHDYAAGVVVIRATTSSRLAELVEKVSACLNAGAQATGARAEIKITPGYKDHVPNAVLAERYTRYWNALPYLPVPAIPPSGTFAYVKASTDQGDLSYALPSVNASFAIGGERPPHTREFERSSGTKDAFETALRVGAALAGIAVDVLSTPGLLEEVKVRWRKDMEDMRDAGACDGEYE